MSDETHNNTHAGLLGNILMLAYIKSAKQLNMPIQELTQKLPLAVDNYLQWCNENDINPFRGST